MNKLIILCGMVLLGTTSTPQTSDPDDLNSSNEMVSSVFNLEITTVNPEHLKLEYMTCEDHVAADELVIASIAYEEFEEEIDLGFDTADYLPENFDPTKFYVDLSAVAFIEDIEAEELELDLSTYLPEGFDPYASPSDFMHISYMEEEEIDLGFDTRTMLPEGFDPYSKELDLRTIVYIEEEDIEFGFDTSSYMPLNFDPYSF